MGSDPDASLSPSSSTPNLEIPKRTSMSSSIRTHSPLGQNREASPSPSPRSGSVSLQAAATLNAGLQRKDSLRGSTTSPLNTSQTPKIPSAGRRQSQVLMNLQMNDPSIPAPGEMISDSSKPSSVSSPQPIPGRSQQHNRAPSLGELHQELENEQEYQVNRLLSEIRRLQSQLQRQQSSGAISDDNSGRDTPNHSSTPLMGGVSGTSIPKSPGYLPHPRGSFDFPRSNNNDLNKARSRTPSRGASPRVRATSISADSMDQWALGGRDESAFYQAETQMLVRENQMLRHRIRELERQLAESSGKDVAITHEPTHASGLHRSTSISDVERPKMNAPSQSHQEEAIAE
ncbi:hypothetical protein SMACR_03783 [Sordaria macrospora]|uniref:WGS project CABT00000000 data, contig 2.16 n=2 Tax=Sordaria macrospora TaxID=5147 RepID=F7VZX7_SORMK|nr:uncharacterized protein SMAC_03783 [Sordaria macrospora k-hell]KAA8628378.1 hypothetical protein SMACR_03783 [Sordaria macrospora]WPJ61578.1 hypothetical protein SMAC4_03783 [Sordaria macrospora]CCC11076.1 unnamed protein product [Sordaria macrospora k-hell]